MEGNSVLSLSVSLAGWRDNNGGSSRTQTQVQHLGVNTINEGWCGRGERRRERRSDGWSSGENTYSTCVFLYMTLLFVYASVSFYFCCAFSTPTFIPCVLQFVSSRTL